MNIREGLVLVIAVGVGTACSGCGDSGSPLSPSGVGGGIFRSFVVAHGRHGADDQQRERRREDGCDGPRSFVHGASFTPSPILWQYAPSVAPGRVEMTRRWSVLTTLLDGPGK